MYKHNIFFLNIYMHMFVFKYTRIYYVNKNFIKNFNFTALKLINLWVSLMINLLKETNLMLDLCPGQKASSKVGSGDISGRIVPF